MSRYENKLAEVLYLDSLSGTYETTGSVDFDGFYSLINVDTVLELNDEDGNEVVIGPGDYLVYECDSGFVYATDVNAVFKFKEAHRRYCDWRDRS